MRKIGCFFTVTGILLLSASIVLCFYNMWDTKRANETAAVALEILVSKNSQFSAKEGALNQNPTEQALQNYGELGEEAAIPDYQLNPAMDMPVQEKIQLQKC